MTTIKQLADQQRIGVSVVKQLLRSEYPGEDFVSADRALTSEQIQRVVSGLPGFREARRRPTTPPTTTDSQPTLAAAGVQLAATAPHPIPPRRGRKHRLLVHDDVVAFLEDRRGELRPRQAAVQRLMRGMLVDGRAQRGVKGTAGANRGWLRAPIGDNGGSHYYLWHALSGTPRISALELEPGEVVVRAVRHHDETNDPLDAGGRSAYVVLDASDYVTQIEDTASAADVLSPAQREAYDRPGAVTITKGHPGAGKTTLHLERTRRHGGPILFMTFGAAQRAQGQRWLETYAPQGQEFRAWTHQEFFRCLDPKIVATPPPEHAIDVLRTRLGHLRLGPWQGHWGALHAELRAWYWGRALPLEFRGVAAVTASDGMDEAYRQRRSSTLSAPAIDAAALAARSLAPPDRASLFGDLDGARELAARLLAGSDLPPELADVEAMLVDEVQDLTLIESLVCVLVAQRPLVGGAARPAFHVAGDEGQTVRATDFDWGELKDLVNKALGAPIEIELPGNLRSPRTITHIINNSWMLYQALDKDMRPRGYAAAEAEEAAVGSVMWVDAGGESLAGVAALVAQTPGAALIYPDVVVPSEVSAVAASAGAPVLAASEAKGLDFRVAVVLDVARQVEALAAMPHDDTGVVAIEERIRVDAVRVALSRATEVLVLAERPLSPQARGHLELLCSDQGQLFEGVVTDVAADELPGRVDLDTSDRVEIVTTALTEFDALFESDPARGLTIIARARGWLGDSARAGAVQGDLRRQVYRAHGRALIAAFITEPARREERLSAANRELNNAKDTEGARLALDVRDAFKQTDKLKPGLQRIADIVRSGASDLRRLAASLLDQLLDDLEVRAPGFDARDWDRVMKSLGAIAPVEARSFISVQVEARVASLALAAARWALARSPGKAATTVAEEALLLVAEPPTELRAQVAERRGDWDDAVALFLEAGRPDEALRLARAHDQDGARALDLARQGKTPEVELLERLARIHADLAALDTTAMTEAEKDRLAHAAKDRLGGSKR